MAEMIRPVKPGVYAKIMDNKPITEHDGIYIDSPYFAQKRAEYIADGVKRNFEKYFLMPGSTDQIESFRILVSQYCKCPLNWVKVSRGKDGFDILISPDVPMELLSMEVSRET